VIDENDMMAGRTVWQNGSPEGEPIKPEGDNRHRVQDSLKFYVIQLVGTWVNVSEYGERVLQRQNRQSYVVFENARHQVRPENQFKAILKQFVDVDCPIHIGSLDVTKDNLGEIEPFPFIYIAPKISYAAFRAYYVDKNYAEFIEKLRKEKGQPNWTGF
jgi:hypothetical protein